MLPKTQWVKHIIWRSGSCVSYYCMGHAWASQCLPQPSGIYPGGAVVSLGHCCTAPCISKCCGGKREHFQKPCPWWHDPVIPSIRRAHLPGAGIFQCSITGLGFKVKSAVTITYRYTTWSTHLSKANEEMWVPAGPLFDIKVQPRVVQKIYLPHFICLAEDVDTSQCFIAHFKSGAMMLERPTRVVAFSAVLRNPSFSLLGVLWRKLCSALHSFPVHSLVLIYQQLRAANTTFHLYLIPDDNSLKGWI
uniref:FIIND domain-containing protein n=1 Tax=Amazona collaria TaxID=241587 RepID=A0A8B9F280_9PSIT